MNKLPTATRTLHGKAYPPPKKDIEKLKLLGACEEAIKYLENFRSLRDAWQKCHRGDWMLWYAGKMSGGSKSKSRKLLVLAACKCARLALKYVPKKEKLPLKTIQTAEKWATGKISVSLENVRAAADAADAAGAAYADAAAYAAAYAAAHADAKTKILKKCADTVRKFYPQPPK